MSKHTSVLLNETIEGLNLPQKGLIVDGTFGGGGHSREVLNRSPKINIIAIDQDKGAWRRAKTKFKGVGEQVKFVNMNFRDIDTLHLVDVDGMMLDLGLSSDQLEISGRGFTFLKDEPLLMTMKEDPKEEDLKAVDILNDWSEENIAKIIYGYGGERYARRIAKAICEKRDKHPFKTTLDLVKTIEESIPDIYKRRKIHPATKTFQALRIAVNDELGALDSGIRNGFESLKSGGRMAIISFHSLEDRIVKNVFKNLAKQKKGILINKKPITPSKEEIKENPRSRSAKLRIIEKI